MKESSEASTVSQVAGNRAFCTCSERPASVAHVEQPMFAEAADADAQPRYYCTCQVPQPAEGDDSAVSEMPDEPPRIEMVDDIADAVDANAGPRYYCTCQVPQPPEDDGSVVSEMSDEPPRIEVGDDIADVVDADAEPRYYCTCQVPQPADDDDSADSEIPEEPFHIEIGDVIEAVVAPTPDATESQVEDDHGETDLARLDTPDGEILLTDRRVVMHGNAESRTVLASMSIDEVTGARIDRTQRGIRGWVWTAVGAAATIAIWQILDGGGWIRLAFPGLVALSTLVMLITTLVSPLHLIFGVIGRNGDKIEARISAKELDAADEFAGMVIQEAHAVAERARRSSNPQ